MKGLLLIVLSSILGLSVFGQKIRFSDTSNIWNYYPLTCCNPPTFTPQSEPFFPIYFGGPVIHSGIIYYPLSGALIREDTITRIVYATMYRSWSGIYDSTERILYNYNAVIGDTVNRIISNDSYVSWVVGIDSTFINGIWYKVWHLESNDSEAHHFIGNAFYNVIEGIGCTNGLLYPLNSYPEFEFSEQLFCFRNHGMSYPLSNPVPSWGLLGDIYFDDSSSCLFPLEVSKVPSKNDKNNVYPNPTTSELFISSSDRISTVAITNLLGQTVYTRECTTETVQVDVANLPSGIYLIKINGTEVRKFVKR